MASALSHIELANKNHQTLHYLLEEPGSHSEWIATISFYKAVQVVEAVFAIDSNHSFNHDSRIKSLRSEKFKNLFKAYRPLYVASLVARYLADSASRKVYDDPPAGGGVANFASFSDYLAPEDVVRRLVNRRLRAVESEARAFMPDSLKAEMLMIEKQEVATEE